MKKVVSLKVDGSLVEYIAAMILFVAGANFLIYLKTAGLDLIYFEGFSRPFVPLNAHLEASIAGFITGLGVIFFETIIYPKFSFSSKFKKRIIWVLIIILIIVVVALFTFISTRLLATSYNLGTAIEEGVQFITSGLFLSFMIFFLIISALVSFLRQMCINFGEAVFFNYVLGKYIEPEEEERSFMFIDLNDSTYIAEVLGHVKYSRFLNRCFDDILEALEGYDYEVYQFVGDEIVLTWETRKADYGKAIKMYNSIYERLEMYRVFYEQKFKIAPKFKAAINSGKVIATMVGGKHRKMAYHGDVLNTTARLLELCNRYGKDILMTQSYLKSLNVPWTFQPIYLTSLKLRGKNNTSKIFAVNY